MRDCLVPDRRCVEGSLLGERHCTDEHRKLSGSYLRVGRACIERGKLAVLLPLPHRSGRYVMTLSQVVVEATQAGTAVVNGTSRAWSISRLE